MTRARSFSDSQAALFDHEEAPLAALAPAEKLPSYIKDHRARLRERFLSGGRTPCRITRCWNWCFSGRFPAAT